MYFMVVATGDFLYHNPRGYLLVFWRQEWKGESHLYL